MANFGTANHRVPARSAPWMIHSLLGNGSRLSMRFLGFNADSHQSSRESSGSGSGEGLRVHTAVGNIKVEIFVGVGSMMNRKGYSVNVDLRYSR